ncbi:hypothetical protein BCR42DRAFT_496190 [Absidia repens]|uniref:Ser-Thr-rich glycosyl-phosphatidyl-inositol-anchored membrane family-domain-containing protein n=1 Tax=Absidia repens TaxID=90262 RepID=A0A1X2I0L6_9FUNG|nr:hypothetical protein BCR42DRAFT_496190 [Absidia repens]
MKVFYHLASLTTAATLILQLGTFVDASPFFTENTASIHGNDADTTAQCEGLRFSFPADSGLTFEEKSKHVVAWQAPSALDNVVLSLVKEGDASTPISVGNYDAKSGATKELPLDLQGQQPGTYHYHIQATGSAGDCSVDSVAFTVSQQQQQQQQQSDTHQPSTSTQDDQHSNNDETFDNLIQSIKGQTFSNEHIDSQLDELVNDLKQTQNSHSNDQTFDDLVSNISKTNTASDPDHSLDGLVNDLKQTEAQHSNDKVLDELINDWKQSKSQHSNDDVLDGLVNDLKSTQDRHSNDQDFDNLISNLSSNNGDSNVDSLTKDIKSATKTSDAQPGHQDIALNVDLDLLSQKPTDDIAKTAKENDHQNDSNDSKSSPDWDSMIDDLNSLSSHQDQQEPKSQGLDQVIDDLAKSIKDEQSKKKEKAPATNEDKDKHLDDASETATFQSFKAFIDSLDQEYTKYLQNNKNSETKQVSHKNDAKPDLTAPPTEASHANEWFTNSDLRTKSKIAKRGESNYFTNDDRRSSHANDASISRPPATSRPVWATNGGFFTNDDQRTNVNSGVHNDAEWAEDSAPVEQTASRPIWSTNGGFFTNDDQRTNVNSGVHNDAEWAEDSAPVEQTASRPIWSTNGGFFTNDDQRTNVNSGVHNDAEWAEDSAPVEQTSEDGVWHSDEVADIPEWNVDSNDTPLAEHQNGPWETFEHGDEPSYVASDAPVHHPNDNEWNVHNDSPLMDHTNFVHWDSEAIDASVESADDDNDHLNAAPEGEWVDDHFNDVEDLEWAQDSIEDLEDDVTHGNGEWQTDEHANDDDLPDDSSRWNLHEDATEWSSNAFDENDVASIPGNHANDATTSEDVAPEWFSSEHANDDHEDDVTWSMNDGPAEWSVDEDSHGNDASSMEGKSAGDDHVNDATFISEWLTSEHANDDLEDGIKWNVNEAATEWNVNEAATEWNVNEAATEWNVNEAATEWNVNEAPSGWNVNETPAKWNVNEVPAKWTTNEHANDDQQQSPEWSLNEDPAEWSMDAIDLDGTVEVASNEGQHDNAVNDVTTDAQWHTSEHANDDHEDDATWSVNDGPAEWSVDGDVQSMAAGERHDNASPAEWVTSEHANDDDEQHINADEWNVNEASGDWNIDSSSGSTDAKQHSNVSPQWLTAHTDHSDADSEYWQVNGDWATDDVTW